MASQPDGKSSLNTKGEVHITLHRGTKKFPLQAVVVEHLDCDVLVGMPFLKENDIVLDIPSDRIVIGGTLSIPYTTSQIAKLQANRTSSFLLRSDEKFVLMPGEYREFQNPTGLSDDAIIAVDMVEPRCDSANPQWPHPTITRSIGGQIRMVNETEEPIAVSKHQHIAQVRHTYMPSATSPSPEAPTQPSVNKVLCAEVSDRISLIAVDPDNELLPSEREAFTSLH